MFELRDFIKAKSYVINSFVLKNINKLNISTNELLLLIYFMNGNSVFDPKIMKEALGLEEKESLDVFNSLIKKKFIEIKVKKGNVVEEIVSLDLFYNQLLISCEKQEIVNSDIFTAFEKEFGRTLSPFEYEMISGWIENKISEELILKALKEASLNDVRNLRYIDKILFEWSKKNIKGNVKKEEKDQKLFDYDWLDDNE